MSRLQERVQAALDAGYSRTQLAKAAGKTASAVSQWLSGETKTLSGDAVAGIAQLTGWAPQWWATGSGPRQKPTLVVQSQDASATAAAPYDIEAALEVVGMALAALPVPKREAAAASFAGWAREGGADHWRNMLSILFTTESSSKQVGM